MSVLRAEGVSVRLGGRRVLREVGISVDAGELVGLIGPNGAGKTTLLRAILGVIRTESGRVEIEGEPIGRVRSRVGYVPQRHEFAWDFPITVEDTVMTGLVRGIGWLRRPGQRQRVLVARALALRPSLLLLDEPFTGLDMPTQELLLELFDGLAAEGRAVLMSTHDLSGAMHQCSRLCLINRTVIADAPPAELQDAEIWMRAFGVRADNPVLRVLGVAA